MQKIIPMPTKDELAELSHAELNERIQQAFDQWLEARKRGKNVKETKAIHEAYDNEQLSRLHRIKRYLAHNFD
jgi:hypothetical protein